MSNSITISSMSLIKRLEIIPKCNLDFISQLRSTDTAGQLEGDCKGYAFMITYKKDSHLLLSLPTTDDKSAWGEAFTALRVACEGFMDADPICQYTTDEHKILSLEWELIRPDQILDDIINSGGHCAKTHASDIILFGGRKISDYENTETKQRNAELEAERIRNARIYGLDTGGYNKDDLDKMPEWELFLEYYGITKMSWRINHELGHGRGPEGEIQRTRLRAEVNEMQYAIEYLIYYISKRLDIPVSEPEVDKHVLPNREIFMQWYGFYDRHFMHILSGEEWKAFEAAREKKEDVSKFLPTGEWHDYHL